MLDKLKNVGHYLKNTYDNKQGLYSVLFLTAATIAVSTGFSVAGLAALGSETAIPLVVAGLCGIGLGTYAGAPFVKEFSLGLKNAYQSNNQAKSVSSSCILPSGPCPHNDSKVSQVSQQSAVSSSFSHCADISEKPICKNAHGLDHNLGSQGLSYKMS